MTKSYIPDTWVVIKVDTPETKWYRILAGWYGSYLSGESWRLNSGIEGVEELEEPYQMAGYRVVGPTRTTYLCYKNREGTSGYTAGVLRSIQESLPEGVSYTIIPMKECPYYSNI